MAFGAPVDSEAIVVGSHDHPDVLAGKKVSVQVVTPVGMLLARSVDEVIAPGVLGEFGVLAGHIPFLSALKPGVLTIRDGATRERYAVGGGYLEVGAGNKTVVLVDKAAAAEDIDEAAARAEEQDLNARLKASVDSGESSALQAKLDWAQARLAAKSASAPSRH
jgi:F-type H+-transporting ATPase subunit epsilon